MDRLGEMTVFATVATEGGFSAAAQVLHLSPSAVSKQINRLEDRLGVRLLNRTTRALSLTAEGKIFYDRCRHILAEIDEAENVLVADRKTPRGLLRINAATAMGRHVIAPLLASFLESYPEVRIELTLTDHIVDLVHEGVDLAIRIAALPDSTLVARKLLPVHRLIVASPTYLARQGRPRTPHDLTGHNCIIFENLTDWHFETEEGLKTIRVSGNLNTNDAAAMRAAVVNHAGIGRIASFYIEPLLASGDLVPLLTQYLTVEDTAVYAVYPPGRHMAPKVRAFLDFLIERMPAPSVEYPYCPIHLAEA